jgi:hypothetical protein
VFAKARAAVAIRLKACSFDWHIDRTAWAVIVEALNREAERLGVTWRALIKLWIADRLGKAA